MDIDTIIAKLEAEWDYTLHTGFFGKLRGGELDLVGFERVKILLDAIPIPDGDIEILNRRIVELVWFMPTFLRWQRDGWIHDGKETTQLDEIIAFFEGRITSILGLP